MQAELATYESSAKANQTHLSEAQHDLETDGAGLPQLPHLQQAVAEAEEQASFNYSKFESRRCSYSV